MAAYVNEEHVEESVEEDVGYADFAVMTAQQVVVEETDKLQKEIYEDVGNMMESWGERLMTRIDARMEQLGIQQTLQITVSWDPKQMPTFKFHGATDVGIEDDEDQ